MNGARRRTASTLAIGLALAAGALGCSPPDPTNAGFNGYATDIVLGSQTKPTDPTLPPVVGASPDPQFPGFIAPAPSPIAFETPAPTTPPAPPPTLPSKCPEAPVTVIPPAAALTIDKPPANGVYSYRQTGSFKVPPSNKETPLPEATERKVQNPVQLPTGDFTYEIVERQLGATTTNTYRVVRSGSADTNGVYLARTVRMNPDQTTDLFEPTPPGLRMFPMPAGVGLTFRSTATDGIHQTAMALKGAVRAQNRIDACGDLVEGWLTEVTIHVSEGGQPVGGKITRINATFTVVPQLGGLIVADKTIVTLTDNYDIVGQDAPPKPTTTTNPNVGATPPIPDVPRTPDQQLSVTDVIINKLTPVRPA